MSSVSFMANPSSKPNKKKQKQKKLEEIKITTFYKLKKKNNFILKQINKKKVYIKIN